MNTRQRLDRTIEPRALLKHPFYQAWNAGTLPVEALRAYAREYGAFIDALPQAWRTLGDAQTAQEEIEHADMWRAFAAALETEVGEPQIAEVAGLMDAGRSLFADRVAALGALYAFEAQQPATAQSKLDGLRAHYPLPRSAERYFEAHARNDHEADKLLRRIEALPAADQDRVEQACAAMSQALWDGLSGIYNRSRARI